LIEFDWRIDVKRASETVSSMSVPTVLVQLQLDDRTEIEPEKKSVSFELNKQALEAMIDGLSKIKAQLSKLASPNK